MKCRLFVAVLGLWAACGLNGFTQQPLPASKATTGPSLIPPPSPALSPAQAPASNPMANPMANPALAQAIVRTLKESGQLSQYRIHVHAQGGVVDLVGEVADENQHDIVVRLLRTVPGIAVVRDWLTIRQEGNPAGRQNVPGPSILPVQAPLLQPLPQPLPLPLVGPTLPAPKVPDRIDGQLQEPTPIYQPQMGPNPTIQTPPMPPYAWPTYAPYNNVSRVAYPNAYSYEQWPFIGPMYPFPRVPLGWRSVSLTWEDGYWWFHRNPTGHDWWRIRYH